MVKSSSSKIGIGSGSKYPLLPLRDIVVFPHMIVPLFVGREKSILALEEVMENREEIPDVVKRLEKGRETVYSAYKQLKAKRTGDITIPDLFIGPYFAGKQRLVKDIIARMPEHQCYVEPFGGFCQAPRLPAGGGRGRTIQPCQGLFADGLARCQAGQVLPSG